MPKTLYIRPVCEEATDWLKGLCLCRMKDTPPLVDSDIVEHFPKDVSGKDIAAAAKEVHGAESTEWGTPMYYT